MEVQTAEILPLLDFLSLSLLTLYITFLFFKLNTYSLAVKTTFCQVETFLATFFLVAVYLDSV